MKVKPNYSNSVKLALELDKEGGNFLVEFTPGEAFAFLIQDKDFNRYKRESVIKILEDIHNTLPPKVNIHYKIGNESSRVIYCCIPNDVITNQMIKNFYDYVAWNGYTDQLTFNNKSFYFEIRMWWD